MSDVIRKWERRMNEPIGPIMGGLIVDPMQARIDKLEQRISKLEKLAYTNPSGCCCRFDENDNIIELCKAHADYFEKRRTSCRKTHTHGP